MRSIIFIYILSLFATNTYAGEERFDSLILETTVSIHELELQRGLGGIDITTLNLNNIKASMSEVTAINNTTGFNVIDNGAFAGSGGIISVIQNTGNNVIIQDSTIVNVTIIP